MRAFINASRLAARIYTVRPASVYVPKRFLAHSQKQNQMINVEMLMMSCKSLYTMSLMDLKSIADEKDIESNIKEEVEDIT
ncbi:hypothetical protein SteCoe_24903 [Stentor coeruleus]|uniref:Uncharacterized protein n=1 Tax=Stentor coeruleus TaxID=5963 RepID=A0A1R2BGJ0_9CILI|nr:hypothetical protein SteCoe_24903 [Stentor coeruleus]